MPELIDRLQTTLGSGYRVTSELGGGGMSRVFVADDVELNRTVVVKVLPPDLAAGLNVDRFRREIQLAARLQHPHIVPVLSAGAKDGLLYYTMPLIEGESLRARLLRSGELPIPEAARIMRDVADALEYAHAHGIVHRDIKPENILVSGHHALVTDFGVSKALSEATGQTNLTSVGVALGTPTYMSPEQATADPMTDHRSDIYALGVVGYELLAGRPPFTGNTPQQVLAAQVTEAPVPISKHRANIPPILASVIMRCLEKKPADRFQRAEEIREQLEVVGTPSGGVTPHGTAPVRAVSARQFRPKQAAIVGGIVVVLLAISLVAGKYIGGSGPAFEVSATRQLTNQEGIEITPALSPDGKMLAYAAGTAQQTSIFVRQVSGGEPIKIADGRGPQWSPAGDTVVFADKGDGVSQVPALGGTARRLIAPRGNSTVFGGAYSHDGKRLAFGTSDGALTVADADGSNQRKILSGFDPHSVSWAPDDSRIAFVSGNAQSIYGPGQRGGGQFGNLSPSSLWITGANGKGATKISDDTHLHLSPVWAPDGSGIFFISSEAGGRDLYYQRVRGTAVTGAPQRLTTGLNIHGISVGPDGTIAYSVLTTSVGIWSIPVPASGSVSVGEATQITSATERIEHPAVSADGKWLAFDSDRSGNSDIYKMHVDGTGLEQLTRDPADDFRPGWSPDGSKIVFHSWRNGTRDVFTMSSDGTNQQLVAGGPANEYADAWSPDGKQIAIFSDRTGQRVAYVVASTGGTPRRVSDSELSIFSDWSPDGKLIAYVGPHDALEVVSAEGGHARVLVTRDKLGAVNAVGGWSRDSRWIYFRTVRSDGGMDIARVAPDGTNPSVIVRFDRRDRQAYRPEFSTDGKTFYFTIGKHEADIWLMKLGKK